MDKKNVLGHVHSFYMQYSGRGGVGTQTHLISVPLILPCLERSPGTILLAPLPRQCVVLGDQSTSKPHNREFVGVVQSLLSSLDLLSDAGFGDGLMRETV